jgi:hypothetical protein
MIKASFIPRLAFRLTGSFTVDGMVGMDSQDAAALGLKLDEVHRNKYAARGVIMDDGTLNSWGVPFEGAHFALFECGHQFNPLDEKSCNGMRQMQQDGMEICLKTPFSISWASLGAEDLNLVGPLCQNYPVWMRKIKKAFDPRTVSDPTGYTSAE